MVIMPSPITAEQLANYVVDRCIDDKHPVSNLQLQKIMYLIQAHFLREDEVSLFDDEFHAWRYGPVIPEIYREFSLNVGNPITRKHVEEELTELNPETVNRIYQMVCTCRAYYPWALVDISHRSNGAWARTYKNGGGYDAVISKHLIARDSTLKDVV